MTDAPLVPNITWKRTKGKQQRSERGRERGGARDLKCIYKVPAGELRLAFDDTGVNTITVDGFRRPSDS